MNDGVEITPVPFSSSGGNGRSFGTYVFVLVILGLLGTVGYLMSELNSRRYRIVTEDHHMVVQRGRFLPYGFEHFVPHDDALKAVYAPIPIPTENSDSIPTSNIYDDRADVDRTLFTLMAGWAHQALAHDNPEALQEANGYVERSERLPGLSEEQRKELRILRGDVSYSKGRAMLVELKNLLIQTRNAFQLSVEMGTSRASDAQYWIKNINDRFGLFIDHHDPAASTSISQENTAPGMEKTELPTETSPHVQTHHDLSPPAMAP